MLFKQLYHRYFSPNKKFNTQLALLLGFMPSNMKPYQLAFKHKSRFKHNNERLEFLGDTILDAVVSHEIYLKFHKKNEGDLSKLRAKAVSRETLNNIGKELKVVDLLEYKIPKVRSESSNLAGNTLEALIGAVYIEQGYSGCYDFVKNRILKPFVHWNTLDRKITDFKSLMFNHAQKYNKSLTFDILEELASSSNNRFEVAVNLDGKELARGKGKNKKNAEQQASKRALKFLKILN